jgi:twitching motility protein PilT
MHPQDRLFGEIAVQLELLTRAQCAECMRAQQTDPSGRSLGAIAMSLGLLTQESADVVMQHQQRVLDRRREARAAGRALREAEERAQALRRADQPSAQRGAEPLTARRGGDAPGQQQLTAAGGDTRKSRVREPTPTTPWTLSGAPAGLARSQSDRAFARASALLSPEQLESEEVRDTLDVRPPPRTPKAVQRTEPIVPGARPPDRVSDWDMLAAEVPPAMHPQPEARSHRPDPTPAEAFAADSGRDRPIRSRPFVAAALSTSLPPPPSAAESSLPPAAGLIQSPWTAAQWHSPPAAASMRSPPLAAQVPPPLPAAQMPPPLPATSFRAAQSGGTLLANSGLEEQQRKLREALEAGMRAPAHPVPTARDWRNPSRPPPASDGFEGEALARAERADTLRASEAPARSRARSLDLPRFVDRALAASVELAASDLQLQVGAPACVRIDGELTPLGSDGPLTRDQLERALREVLDDSQRGQYALAGELRGSYEAAGVGRFRVHAFSSERGDNLSLRIWPRDIPSPERLGLGPALRLLRESMWGLCVCSGPAGSGKTLSLAALTKALALERALHIVSIEHPIELTHDAGLGIVEQREVGRHVPDFAIGIRWAELQGADVIVVSDLSAPGALEACLRVARSRRLVLAGLRASSSASALAKLMHPTDPQQGELRRFELAHSLRLLLHQRLLPRARGSGRVAAFEQTINGGPIAQIIRENKLQQLPTVLAAGKAAGMQTLAGALDELVRTGTIALDAARRVASRRERFEVS